MSVVGVQLVLNRLQHHRYLRRGLADSTSRGCQTSVVHHATYLAIIRIQCSVGKPATAIFEPELIKNEPIRPGTHNQRVG